LNLGGGVTYMSNYKLSRIYFENYKVFNQRELVFSDCSLVVFDGPNGYGKTSVFDAIEFVITGNIKRVLENSAILKNDTYETVFIAGNPKKDVVIKAEFVSDSEPPLVVAKVIPGISKPKKAKKNNPTKLCEITNTYILPSYDQKKYDDSYKCEQSDVEEKIGSDVVRFFSLFYYIRQEDRLEFLNKTEADRMSGINKLFNMETEQREFEDAKKAFRQLNKIYKDLGIAIEKNNSEIIKFEETLNNDGNKNVSKYEKMFTWKKETIIWDQQSFPINDENKKKEIIDSIKQIEIFVKYFEEFRQDEINAWSRNLITNKSDFIYFLFLISLGDRIDIAKEHYDLLFNLKMVKQQFEEGKYAFDYQKIFKIIDINANIELVLELVNQIQNYDKNATELAQTASSINQARNILNDKTKIFIDEHELGGQCPYCGFDWKSKGILIGHINKMTEVFNKFNDENTVQKENKLKELREIFRNDILPAIEKFINENKDIDNEVAKYVFDVKNNIENKYQSFMGDCKKYNINIDQFIKSNIYDNISEDNIKKLENHITQLIKPISTEYANSKEKIDYNDLYQEYFYSDSENIGLVSEEKIYKKISYVEYNYYNATFEKIEALRENIAKSQRKFDLIGNEIIPQTEQYKNMLQSKIESYQSQIVKNIEIPFYLYTGRIMQSYQGGIGVLIKEPEPSTGDNEDITGLKSIRFISPLRPDHDILYTLSSGQLSSVIIAFTLALNKIYSYELFKCIFIDDPVQTMDELNIASFVELLRNEFGDKQVVLSTHEDSFSRYARYKYEKYNLKAEPITLKNI
jgi:exonuclease SbcC